MKTIGSFTGLITLFLFLFLNALPGLALAIPKAPELDKAEKTQIIQNYGKLPLSFEENQGQTDKKVGFLSRGGGYTLFLTPDEAVLALSSPLEDKGLGDRQKDALQVSQPEKQKSAKGAVIRMKFSGANASPVISGEERLQETSNYFIGNDPSMWRTRVSKYAKVRYSEVYPGIDLVFYGNQRRLEYDFVVSPGSDPSKISLEFQGVEEVSLNGNGDLVLRLKNGEVIQQAPVIYQEVDGKRMDVAGGYMIDSKGRVGCRVTSWDRQRSLVIDPVLVYSTYLGGSDSDSGHSIAIDSSGNAYVTGWTHSSNFPTVNALYTNLWGSIDAFIFKLSADGSQAVYSTYLGGNDSDLGHAIAVDASGNAYVTGWTHSSNFPTVNALYTNLWGSIDAFIFKLSADGSQAIYSTYLGGNDSDFGNAIAVDASGNAYVTGETSSPNFPTVNALYTNLWGSIDAFIFKLSADGSQAIYSTYLGGNDSDFGNAIAVDASGNAYVTGLTSSPNFPTVNALYTNLWGSIDAFIFKLSADGSQAVYSTYLGGSSYDFGNAIAVDGSGNAYVTGYTESPNFPTVNALYTNLWGYRDAFIFKLSADGSQAIYSTYLGGNDSDFGNAIAVDASGNAYVTGHTYSSDFPLINALYPNYSGYGDAFIFKLIADGSQAVYSTYLGGSDFDIGHAIAVDGSGNAYVTGYTESPNFPTVNALYTNLWGYRDAFVVKISETDNTQTDNTQKVVLLLHGMNSSPDTWNDLVDELFDGSCPVISEGGSKIDGIPKPNKDGLLCYRIQFGHYDKIALDQGRTGLLPEEDANILLTELAKNPSAASGDFSSFDQLGDEVRKAVQTIMESHKEAKIAVVAHSRGGLAARSFLQGTSPERENVFSLLTIGTPHQGSPLGRVNQWLKSCDPSCNLWDFDVTCPCENDWEVADFLRGARQGGNPVCYFAQDDNIDVRRPTIDDLSDISVAIANINKNIGNLPSGIVYGNMIFDGVDLGYLASLKVSDWKYTIFNVSVNDLCDQISKPAEIFILGSDKPSYFLGDGIVPANSQNLLNIGGAPSTKIYSIFNDILHTAEPKQCYDIACALYDMLPEWGTFGVYTTLSDNLDMLVPSLRFGSGTLGLVFRYAGSPDGNYYWSLDLDDIEEKNNYYASSGINENLNISLLLELNGILYEIELKYIGTYNNRLYWELLSVNYV